MGILALFLLLVLGYSTGRPMDGKILGLINIVNFQNKECITVSSTPESTTAGTCFTSSECDSMGGISDGNCAAGFGVCCVIRVNTCGGRINKNCTYIQNPNYPTPIIQTSPSCQFSFERPSINGDNICRVRLDFETFAIQDPSSTGSCGNENLNVISTTGTLIPTLCGSLTNDHMYITAEPKVDPGSLTINFDTNNNFSRRWNIKVLFIDCRDGILPPEGCLQYFTGVAGSFRNYNFGQLIRNSAYNTCFRQESGFCGINYSVRSQAGINPFKIGSETTSKITTTNCPNFRIIIPTKIANVFCGNFLNTMNDEMLNGVISSTAFMVRLEVNDMDVTGTGYNLNFAQTPC